MKEPASTVEEFSLRDMILINYSSIIYNFSKKEREEFDCFLRIIQNYFWKIEQFQRNGTLIL